MRVFIFLLIFTTVAANAFAGGMSADKCEKMGTLDYTCTVCSSGQKLGMVTTKAVYNPELGDCGALYKEALTKCEKIYTGDLPPNTRMATKYEHQAGISEKWGISPKGCKR